MSTQVPRSEANEAEPPPRQAPSLVAAPFVEDASRRCAGADLDDRAPSTSVRLGPLFRIDNPALSDALVVLFGHQTLRRVKAAELLRREVLATRFV